MKIKEYKNHSLVDEKYKWDLENILKGKTLKEHCKTLFSIFDKLIEMKESKFENIDNFLSNLKIEDELALQSNIVHNYISNSLSINVVNSKLKQIEDELQFKLNDYSNRLGSQINQYFKNQSLVEKWLKDPRLKPYQKNLESLFEQKQHKLSDEIEEFIIKTSKAEVNPYDVFSILSNTELVYDDAVDCNEKKHKVSSGMYISLMQNQDKKIRETAYKSYIKAHFRHVNSFSQLLYDRFKYLSTWAKIRKYNTTVESFLQSDHVDPKLLNSLFTSCEKHTHLFKKYFKLKKEFYFDKFGIKMEKWDSLVPLVDANATFSIEEAQNHVIESIKPFGHEYHSIYSNAILKDRWIDYMPVKNKRSGAYSIGGSFGVDKKYILMNFDGTLRSVETLAHEMGHSMHSYFSDLTQDINNASYPIFLAEIASIFNELMLFDHLIKNSNDDKLKFKIINNMIMGFEGTVMRQTEWANFEFTLYNEIDKGNPHSTYAQISKLYYENSKKYERNWKVKNDPKELIRAVTVPHFYYNFYVYKYAIGQICANIFFEKYKNEGLEALQQYINKFLKLGGSKWPLDILKNSGINLYDESVYNLAFKVVEKNISLFEKIGKKLFKN